MGEPWKTKFADPEANNAARDASGQGCKCIRAGVQGCRHARTMHRGFWGHAQGLVGACTGYAHSMHRAPRGLILMLMLLHLPHLLTAFQNQPAYSFISFCIVTLLVRPPFIASLQLFMLLLQLLQQHLSPTPLTILCHVLCNAPRPSSPLSSSHTPCGHNLLMQSHLDQCPSWYTSAILHHTPIYLSHTAIHPSYTRPYSDRSQPYSC